MFTKQEIKVIFFVFFCFFAGIIISRYFKVHPYRRKFLLSEEEKKFFYGQKININSADFSQLLSIPGIGPSLAEAILEYRKLKGPFREINQLLEIRGIGSQRLQELSKYIEIN